MFKEGDVAFTPVTDHPDFPKTFHVGDYCICKTREDCQHTCDVWNSYRSPSSLYAWHVKEVVLLAKREGAQDDLF